MSDDAGPIEISYQLTDDDLFHLVMHSKSARFGWSGRTIVKVVMIYIAIMFGLLIYVLPDLLGMVGDNPGILPVRIGLLGAGAVLVGFYPAYNRWYTRRASLAYQTLPLPLKLVIDDKGIQSELVDQTGTTGWRLVQRAVETDSHFLLYLSRMRGFIIPKSAVGSASRLDALRGLIAKHVADWQTPAKV